MEKDIMDLAHRIKVAVLAEVGEDYDQMLESRVSAVDFVTQEIAKDFISSDSDYWTRLEHQYAGMAMQGMLSGKWLDVIYEIAKSDGEAFDILTHKAIDIAHALVEKLKKKEVILTQEQIDTMVHESCVLFCKHCRCGVPRETCTSLGSCKDHNEFVSLVRQMRKAQKRQEYTDSTLDREAMCECRKLTKQRESEVDEYLKKMEE